MGLISDPDDLRVATELVISTSGKTIQLLVAGNLSTLGVTLKCVYSKMKDLWDDAAYNKYDFPFTPITDEQVELINGWDFADDTTRYLIRTGGWAVKDTGGVSLEEWAGVVTLGTMVAGTQAYFQQTVGAGVAGTNFQLTGAVNQAVKVYGDVTHGNFDYRGTLNLFARKQGQTFASSTLGDIGVGALTYQAYRFPLSNAADSKISTADIGIDANSDGVADVAPYDGMALTWYAAAQERTIGGVAYNFHVVIDANGGTLEQVYEFVQFELRQGASIDIDAGAGTKRGKVTPSLVRFVGDTLYCNSYTTGGVVIDDVQTTDKNRLWFVDDLVAAVRYPYTAVLTLNFGDNLKNDADAVYRVYFTNDDAADAPNGYDFGTANAITAKDDTGTDMASTVSGGSSVALTFAYDTNVQRGAGSEGEDAPITVVAIGLETGQYVKATGTITRSTANVVSLVAPLERNYANA